MRCLIGQWNKIKKKIKNKHVYLFLDFDGTLTPIRKHPEKAEISSATKKVLEKLLLQKDVSVAIISGRKLEDAQKRVGVKGIIYVGNHGLEVAGPGLKYTVPEALSAKKAIKKITKEAKEKYRHYRGVFIEDKELTLSIHFRMVNRSRVKKVEQIFENMMRPYKVLKEVIISRGKKVWEIRPPVKWDKGKMVLRLLKDKRRSLQKKVIPFYIGDDKTDEDAFRQLKRDGYSVKVVKRVDAKSLAGYYLRTTGEVRDFLNKLYLFMRGRRKNV